MQFEEIRSVVLTCKSFIRAKMVFHLLIITLILLLSAPLMAESSNEHENLIDMATLLKEREKKLENREAVLDEKEKRIEFLQQELKKQESEIRNTRESFAKVLADLKALKDEDLSRLVEVYTAMKPAAAAPLLEELELKYAVEVILRMPTKKSAKLLSAVEEERAVAISRAITALKPAQ